MVRLNSRKMYLSYYAILTLTPETHKTAGFYKTMKLVISDPIFCEFYIDRGIDSAVNNAVIKFHNLNENTSSLINQLRFEYMGVAHDSMGQLQPSTIELYAFYRGQQPTQYNDPNYFKPIQWVDEDTGIDEVLDNAGMLVTDAEQNLIFRGVITEASTYRNSGATDVITEVFADDRALEMGVITTIFRTGEDKKATIIQLAKEGGYTTVNVGEFDGPLLNNWMTEGLNAFVVINKITGGLAFVDCGSLNILNVNETLADRYAILELSSDTGLLGTPRATGTHLIGEVIFSPEVRLAMRVRITSRVDARWDVEGKVVALTHRGQIGPGSANYAVTGITLILPALAQMSSTNITGQKTQKPNLSKQVKREDVAVALSSTHSVQDVIDYCQQYGRAPVWYITPEITWADAIGVNNLTSGQWPTTIELNRLANTCSIVQGIKNKYYPAGTLKVTSGWRSRAYNATLRGAVSNSTHLRGYALDFYITGYKQSDIVNFLNSTTNNKSNGPRRFPGFSYHMVSYDKVHYDTCNRVGNQQIPVAGWSDP